MADSNYTQAKSDNLPKVDSWMVAEFISENDCFTATEIRGVKELSSGRDSYIESAIGYVDLCRENNICIVRCKVCPEHKVNQKKYTVILKMDESNDKILSVTCMDCVASLGECKHSIAFLMWVNKKIEEPAPTSVESYWRKPRLSNVASNKFVTMKDFGATDLVPAEDGDAFKEDVLQTLLQKDECRNLEILSFYKDKTNIEMLDLHLILIKYKEDCANDFFKYASKLMSETLCQQTADLTQDQFKSQFWYKLRYGRITASKLYNAAHCKKKTDGVVVEQIIGSYKLKETLALERGRVLEETILKVVEEKTNIKFKRTGLILNKNHPVLGVSPDGVSEEYVLEIKCPIAEKTVSRYITQANEVTTKYNSQIQVQMYLCGKKKGLFCVANPDFELNKNVDIITVDFDENFTMNLIKKAEYFWVQNILPLLLKSVQHVS